MNSCHFRRQRCATLLLLLSLGGVRVESASTHCLEGKVLRGGGSSFSLEINFTEYLSSPGKVSDRETAVAPDRSIRDFPKQTLRFSAFTDETLVLPKNASGPCTQGTANVRY